MYCTYTELPKTIKSCASFGGIPPQASSESAEIFFAVKSKHNSVSYKDKRVR